MDKKGVYGFKDEYDFLSNFYQCPVFFEGLLYTSSENAYQASKLGDAYERHQFLDCGPVKAKRMGKTITPTDEFHRDKIEIMFLINFDKFYRNADLKLKLLATGNVYLEETNHWKDVFWGVCDSKGENNLGKVLMKVREVLRLNPSNKGFVI